MELNLKNLNLKRLMHHIQSALLTTLLMKKIVKVCKEIIDFKNFDDVVMSGRQRVNKDPKILVIT